MKKLLLIILLATSNCYAKWQCIKSNELLMMCDVYRMRVPHGWLVATSLSERAGIAYYPDENQEWK